MKKIRVGPKAFAIVDDTDFNKVSRIKWYKKTCHNGLYTYAKAAPKDGNVTMHRFILCVFDKKVFVDHINGDTLDNRRSNLRLATNQQNSRNRKIRFDSSTGVKGLRLRKDGRYEVYICLNGKKRFMGSSRDIKKAKEIRVIAEKTYYGDFARKAG